MSSARTLMGVEFQYSGSLGTGLVVHKKHGHLYICEYYSNDTRRDRKEKSCSNGGM
jgi:hypothetical protein